MPSRLHPGHFYALPQAPQQFKQLLMCSGFDRYFQIAPCFRDEDARADRSPGEFYQLDVEMAFATQEEIFTVIEKLMVDLFTRFSDRPILKDPFPRIPYKTALETYGSDKPDLRFGLEMVDVRTVFQTTAFEVFQKVMQHKRGVLRAIRIPQEHPKAANSSTTHKLRRVPSDSADSPISRSKMENGKAASPNKPQTMSAQP